MHGSDDEQVGKGKKKNLRELQLAIQMFLDYDPHLFVENLKRFHPRAEEKESQDTVDFPSLLKPSASE